MSKSAPGSKVGQERRRTQRRPILDTFSMFCVVPKKGLYRLKVHDVSEHGIGFDVDLEGDEAPISLKGGEALEVHFYLNQSLYLPLSVKVARIEDGGGIRRVGAEFNQKDAGYHAFAAFLKMLDAIGDVAKIA